MGGNSLGYHLLPQVLRRLGLLVMRDQAWTDRDWLKKTRDLVPSGLRQSVSRHLPRVFRHYLSSRWASADIDWGRTQVFCLPSDLQGYLRINLKGREPRGIVEPGLEYEELCAKLTTELGGLTDPSNGQPVVRRIFKSDETFVGPYRHHLPDLIVSWANSRRITEVWSADTGLVSEASPDSRSGNHHAAGFFIMTGPEIGRGSVPDARHICDIAPTMLAFFGLTPPEHMDGNVWTEATNRPVDERGA
jgi:predicted AlkP superfamily phosphohydrolase/phosphomutase